MHGTIMLLLFVSPFALGLANYFVPLQIGAKDMAFPRLNALGYWLTLFAGIVMLGGFAHQGRRRQVRLVRLHAAVRRRALAQRRRRPVDRRRSRSLGVAGVITALNVIATVSTMRAPGMTMFRMPIFTWNMFVTSLLILMTFPVLTAAGVLLFFDRHFDAHIFDPNNGGYPLLWQHLFWWFGHPEVYILVLPFFGVFTEIFAVFSRRPVFGYKTLVFATLGDRVPVRRRVGPPHVHDRRRAAAVLLGHDDAHRRADGREVLQLDRHDVGRQLNFKQPLCGASASC